jgi:hypothetical protein
MTENDVLKIIMQRLGPGWPLPKITEELQGVLLDISSRADFLTAKNTISTVDAQSEYNQPENLKNIYELAIEGGAVLDKKTYRQFLNHWKGLISPTKGTPTEYAMRHKNLYLWPIPDGIYQVKADYSIYHPTVFTDIFFGSEFYEAIYEGVLAALMRGQFWTKSDSSQTNKNFFRNVNGQAEAEKHSDAYEAEIAKLIANLDVETETTFVEYRDI